VDNFSLDNDPPDVCAVQLLTTIPRATFLFG